MILKPDHIRVTERVVVAHTADDSFWDGSTVGLWSPKRDYYPSPGTVVTLADISAV